MDKMIVCVFSNEKSAYEGVKALNDLHAEGSLTVYATAVIAKDAKGVVSVKQGSDQDPLGTVLGFGIGALIGLLGGPAGMAIGAASGTLAGSMYDIARLGIGDDFLDEASRRLSPGRCAVVAEIDEDWVTPLDARMEQLDAFVTRRPRADFIDAQIEQELAADRAEIARLKAEYNEAVGDAKTRLKATLDAAQKHLRTQSDKAKANIDALKREGEAKVHSLQQQAAKAKAQNKARLEKRMAEIRADRQQRVAKLEQAWKLTQEALRP